MNLIKIPHDWKFVKLGEVCKVVSGNGFPLTNQKEVSNGIPFIKVSDMNYPNNSKYMKTYSYFINEEILIKIKAKIYPKNTIIFPKVGGALLTNKRRILSEPACFDNNIMGLIPGKNVDHNFLYYFMLMTKLDKWARVKAPIPSIKQSTVELIEFALPHVNTQKIIVRKLDYIFSQLEKKKKIILQLQDPNKISQFNESLKHHLLLSLRTGKLSEQNWSKYEKKPLHEITEITSGGTPSRTVSEYWNGSIPWIKSGELLDGDIKNSEEHITKLGLKNSSTKLFPPDTVLVALYGQGQTRGRTARLLCEATTNQACCAVLPNPAILYPKYLQYWIRGLYWELRKKASGGAQPNWNSTMIKNIEIVLPPIVEQKSMIDKLDSRFEKLTSIEVVTNQIERKRKKISSYFDTLISGILNVAFSGKLVN